MLEQTLDYTAWVAPARLGFVLLDLFKLVEEVFVNYFKLVSFDKWGVLYRLKLVNLRVAR